MSAITPAQERVRAIQLTEAAIIKSRGSSHELVAALTKLDTCIAELKRIVNPHDSPVRTAETLADAAEQEGTALIDAAEGGGTHRRTNPVDTSTATYTSRETADLAQVAAQRIITDTELATVATELVAANNTLAATVSKLVATVDTLIASVARIRTKTRANWYAIVGVGASTLFGLITIGVLMILLRTERATVDRLQTQVTTDRAIMEQDRTTRTQFLCPIAALRLNSYDLTARAKYPPGPQTYDQEMWSIRASATKLGCAP